MTIIRCDPYMYYEAKVYYTKKKSFPIQKLYRLKSLKDLQYTIYEDVKTKSLNTNHNHSHGY